jgi:glycosyltransferase involved in cell wall biosynthesis
MNSFTYGGVEAHVALLCQEVSKLDYEPLVVCGQRDALAPFYAQLEAEGVPYRLFEERSGPLGKLAAIAELSRLFSAERADIVHVQLIYSEGGRIPILAARLAGIPIVVTHHAARPPKSFDRWARRPLLSLVDEFVAVSRANRADQIRYMGLPPERVTTVHNGIPVPSELPDRQAAHDRLTDALGLPHDTKIVGAVGRLSEQKGLSLLLDAAARILPQVPGLRVVLAGDGPLRGQLEAQVTRLGIAQAVRFLGFRRDTPELLAAFDVLAMPSLFEGLPLVLVEAFAAACPTVATAVDGIPEVVDDEVNGLLVPSGDVGRLATSLVRVLEDKELAARLGAAARAKAVTHFRTERMARETTALYAKLRGKKRAPSTGARELLARLH